MDKNFYRQLLMLVNDHEQMGRLKTYLDARIEAHRNHLETEKDPLKIAALQGAIAELRRFTTLRDEVIKGAE